MSQDPKNIPKESSFLQPKETKLRPMDDPTSLREMKRARTSQEQRESPQDSSFLSLKETETSSSSVSPMNKDAEAFKRFPDSGGNMGSQQYLGPIQMMPTLGYANSRGTWFANPNQDIQKANDTLQYLGISGKGYGTNNPVAGYNVSSSSISGTVGMNVQSVDTGSSCTRDPQHASDNPQRSGMLSTYPKIIMIPTPKLSIKAPSWTITKKLSKTDVKGTRLYLFADSALSHIRQHLSAADSKNVDSGEPVAVDVYDRDLRTMHKLQLVYKDKKWFLRGHWPEDFVQRRGLNEGDEIGLLWDESAYRLQFGVVSRADAKTPA